MVRRLVAMGIAAQPERQRVLVQLPVGDDDRLVAQTYDAVRDAAVAIGAGLLRLERRRGHLEDLFR
jgi:ABC-2 type transport system ATP-binding protein